MVEFQQSRPGCEAWQAGLAHTAPLGEVGGGVVATRARAGFSLLLSLRHSAGHLCAVHTLLNPRGSPRKGTFSHP